MHTRIVRNTLASMLLLVATLAGAESTTVRTFVVPEHGSLQLSVPESWPVELRDAPNRTLPTIAFGPNEGATYQVLITPLAPARKDGPPLAASAVKQMVEQAAQDAKAQSVEKTLVIKELKSGNNAGYYFSATDRAPKPDEYKNLTQGIFSLGEVLLTFTILTNDGYEAIVPAALTMIKSAVQVRDM
jgi:hypothetical protein